MSAPLDTNTLDAPPTSQDDHDEHEHGHEASTLPPLPNIPRARSQSKAVRPAMSMTSAAGAAVAGAGAGPAPSSAPTVAFPALSQTSSRLSQRSNRTFLDPAALINLPELSREETRLMRLERGRAGTVGTIATIVTLPRRSEIMEGLSGDLEEGSEEEIEGKEELVAVQVTDDGTAIVYPDGGLQAYLCLFGGFCAAFCAFGMAASVGAFQTYYEQYLLSDYTSSQIAWIGSAQAAVCFSTCLFTGPLFDLYGTKPLLAAGTFLLVLAFCLLSLCKEFYQVFLCHATLMAFGMDLMFIVPLGAVGQWFFIKRGLAFGILMMGSSAGAIIWPVIMANLPSKIGFGWTVRLIALLIGILGTSPFFHFSEFKNPQYLCVALSFPFFVFGFFPFLTFIGTYGNLMNLGTLAPYLLTITNGSSGFGRVFSGLMADRIGTFNVAFIGQLIMVVMMFAWLAMKSSGALIVLCVIYGFTSGAPVSLQGPMVTAAATDPRLAGTLIGQALMVQSVAQLFGPPIFGAIVGSGSDAEQLARFPHGIAFGGSMLAISTILVFTARLLASRKVWDTV